MRACMQAAAIRAAQPGITYDVRGVNEGGRWGVGWDREFDSTHADLHDRISEPSWQASKAEVR